MLDDKNISIYSSRDKIREQMIELAKNYMELDSVDFSKTSYLSYIIDLLSINTSNLMFYNSSIYREFFLTKSIQKESILNHATVLGYNPPLASPSIVPIHFQIPMTFTTDINIVMEGLSSPGTDVPYFRAYTRTGTPFTLKNKIVIEVSSTSQTAIVREYFGTTDVEDLDPDITTSNRIIPSRVINGRLEFFADFLQVIKFEGTFQIPELNPYEFYNFEVPLKENGYLADVSVTIKSDVLGGNADTSSYIKWTNYQSVYTIPNDEYGFVFRQTDRGIRIFFGNGVVGRRPPSNSEAIVTFTITRGAAGNIISGSIVDFDRLDVVETINGGGSRIRPINMTIINVEPAINGKDAPSLDEIRFNALDKVTLNNRLVSSNDYANVKLLDDTLPINNAIHVLKRSDLKRNEIVLFTDLLYEDGIVPTRNEWTELIIPEDSESPRITQDAIFEINGEKYLTMFDMNIDPVNLNTRYYYNVQDMDKTVIIDAIDRTTTVTKTYPTYVNFHLNRSVDLDAGEKYQMIITLYWNKPAYITEDLSYARCLLKPDWQSFSYENVVMETSQYLEFDDSTENVYYFQQALNIDEIPFGDQTIRFDIYDRNPDGEHIIKFFWNTGTHGTTLPEEPIDGDCYIPTTNVDTWLKDYIYTWDDEEEEWVETEPFKKLVIRNIDDGEIYEWSGTAWVVYEPIILAACHVDIALRNDLNSFMYSQIVKVDPTDDSDRRFRIYDIPFIKKSYYDKIFRNIFNESVYQKLVTFDVNSHKMLTDFVNLKFSNTTGSSHNMQYNPTTKRDVKNINPSTIPTSPSDGDRYAFSNSNNAWNSEPYNKEGGYIAHYSEEEEDWIFEKIRINDIFTVTDFDKKYIYTGDAIVEPTFNIPVEVELVVFTDPNSVSNKETFADKIKNTLIEKMAPNFGYDKSIYVSKITEIVQSISGVRHCKVISPKHDIFFSYDIYENMTEEQILRYTPDLIYFDYDDILIDVR